MAMSEFCSRPGQPCRSSRVGLGALPWARYSTPTSRLPSLRNVTPVIPSCPCAVIDGSLGRSVSDVVQALETKELTCLCRGGDLERQFLQDPADLGHLVGIRLC